MSTKADHFDVRDTTSDAKYSLPAVLPDSARTSFAGFNSELKEATQFNPMTAKLHDVQVGVPSGDQSAPMTQLARAGGTSIDATPATPEPTTRRLDGTRSPSDAASPTAGSDKALPGIKFERRSGSEQFFNAAQQNFADAFNQLNPATQKSLEHLTVRTSSMPPNGIQKDTPGVYNDKPSDTLQLFEKPTLRNKNNPAHVVKHEIGHAIDMHNGNFSQSPEFKKAFDEGVKALPPKLRKDIEAGIKVLGIEQGRAEVMGDLVGLLLGTPKDKMGYLPPEYQPAFKNASDLIKKKFFDK